MQTNDNATRDEVSIDLALQGGGSHGAFTWGVLDRLLEESWLRIDGISGTSAGAMNAVVLVAGWATGGRDGAKSALNDFWSRVSRSARFSPIRRSPLDIILGRWTLDTSPFYLAFDLASRILSPYDLGLPGANPLRDVLVESVDFTAVAAAPIRLFVTATNVRTGRGRVFRNAELTPAVTPAIPPSPLSFASANRKIPFSSRSIRSNAPAHLARRVKSLIV
jgi:NTE family protein